MEKVKYHIAGTVPKSNRKVVETEAKIHTNFLNIATVSALPGISVLASHSTP
jgi:hypothetical protein